MFIKIIISFPFYLSKYDNSIIKFISLNKSFLKCNYLCYALGYFVAESTLFPCIQGEPNFLVNMCFSIYYHHSACCVHCWRQGCLTNSHSSVSSTQFILTFFSSFLQLVGDLSLPPMSVCRHHIFSSST